MKLRYNTVSDLLKAVLINLMQADEFSPFRLVGGTALSLQLGHRKSIDIDLFSDDQYKSIDFEAIDKYLRKTFDYVDTCSFGEVALGKSYYIGNNQNNCIKLDLFYTDNFIQPFNLIDNIRLATIEEITAMKMDVIQRGGRKKDFWDLHEILSNHTLNDLLSLHQQRYPYSHDKEQIIYNLTYFKLADNDFDPICLLGKYWELIKLDFIELLKDYK